MLTANLMGVFAIENISIWSMFLIQMLQQESQCVKIRISTLPIEVLIVWTSDFKYKLTECIIN
ncbi:hypothetical protein PMSM_00455 [Paenibacillus macquariensis subsp. macquariensis]|uniref:Uncharacterized protein n=1 Tax=Paenibacillus macquariensis TaxID=948756 RepID=A0ABY1K309_9BACL|nr:hypothetical protein PMSM_00455 [Paenibacillus macquariensis subsp. macquariensis]SIR18559.1 hypothetical protein SAMN05421578_108100 [Paenibacillus macquariensis]